MTYQEYIESKTIEIKNFGFEAKSIHKKLFPHQKDVVQWSLQGGRRAIFCSFGMGKTVMQLEIAKQCINYTNKAFLIGLPLGRQYWQK